MKSFKTTVIIFLLVLLTYPLQIKAIDTLPAVPVSDSILRDKEAGRTFFGVTVPGTSWDTLLIVLVVKPMLGRIVNSTTEWINNGFNGNPAYATNPKKYFATIADGIAGQFIEGSDLAYLCSPFQLQVKMALLKSYTQPRQFQCTFTGAVGNLQAFYDDFNQGGWDAWFSMTQNNSNNPYGAYVDAKIELDSRIAAAVGLNQQQLDWNSGFISWGQCDAYTVPGSISESGLEECVDSAGKRVERRVVTPGKVIESQLENVLGTNVRQLELADEFDEMVTALTGQLIQKVVFGVGGLFTGDPASQRVESGAGNLPQNVGQGTSYYSSGDYSTTPSSNYPVYSPGDGSSDGSGDGGDTTQDTSGY
jgi:hypothetical protein